MSVLIVWHGFTATYVGMDKSVTVFQQGADVEKLSYPEMATEVRKYFRRIGNKPMASSDVYKDGFEDQDKVRFQLVFSNMALNPPHEMVKLQTSGGTKGVRWRLREPSDPPFVEPVKIPRAKRTVEIEK